MCFANAFWLTEKDESTGRHLIISLLGNGGGRAVV